MHRYIFFLTILLMGIASHVSAATETVVFYPDVSDASIVTGPYPGSWLQQYNDITGRYIWSGGLIAFPYTAVNNSEGGWLGIHRSFMSFDTSVIPVGAIITSAKLIVVPDWVADEVNDVYSYMNVLEGRQSSSTNLTLDDIEMCGDTLENPTRGATDVDLSSIIPKEPLTLALNHFGIDWITKGGYTKLCIREGHDIENKEFINNSNYWQESGIGYYTSENTDTTLIPYLEVTYEVSDPVDEKDSLEYLAELIGAIEEYGLGHKIEKSYMVHLRKVERLLENEKYTPAKKQVRAFMKDLRHDVKTGKIDEAVYNDLRARGETLLGSIPSRK